MQKQLQLVVVNKFKTLPLQHITMEKIQMVKFLQRGVMKDSATIYF